MLTLKEVIGVRWGIGSRWEVINDPARPVVELFRLYRVIQITAMDESGHWCYYPLTDNGDKFNYFQGTVDELINVPGLVFSSTGITLSEKMTKFVSMSTHGYRFELVDDNNVSKQDSNSPTFVGDNLRVIDGGFNLSALDISTLTSDVMFSINGYYHRPSQKTDCVLIKDGGKTFKKSGRYQNAIWDFSSLGGLTYNDIPPDTLVLNGNILQIGLHANVKDKQPILVFMGYPIFIDDTILKVVSPGVYELDISKIGILAKYKEVRDYLDINPVSALLTNHPQLDTDLTNINVLRAMCLLSQSFWVVVNSPSCFVYTEKLKFLNSGLYEYRGVNKGPIRHGYGRHPDYSYNGSLGVYYVCIGGVTDITSTPDRNAEMLVFGSDY